MALRRCFSMSAAWLRRETAMTSRFALVFATALSGVVLIPPLAHPADILLPPYDGSAPPDKVTTDAQALALLHHRGIARVSGLGRVGD
jgi:hypothetical protein